MGHKPRHSQWDFHRAPPTWLARKRTVLASFLLGGLLFLLWANLSLGGGAGAGAALPGLGGRGGAAENAAAAAGLAAPGGVRRRDATLVVYVYNAADEEEQRNFAFFLRYGISEEGPTYRIVITKGAGVLNFPRLPKLPPNAAYLRTERCTGTWGALDAVARALPVAAHEYFLVVDSSVRGPFLPPYVAPLGLHWTEAFTHKLTGRVKLVGSAISCEGAPRHGDAAGEWRGSPYVLPYAWATDRAGWALLAAEPGVFRCHASPWDARFSSDAGASLAVLRAGFGLDCLLARYQGVDWSQPAAWGCNARVRPDLEGHYDGASITPYETVFVPVSEGAAAARWSFVEAAARYEAWADARLRPPERRPGVAGNAWIADHWAAKGARLVAANARGPGCFDFAYYAARGRDLAPLAGDAAALWEHFVLLGQFQGRRHRWTCPLAVGNSYRVAYVLARGPRCFDWGFYAEQHPDLGRAGIATPAALFQHFAEFGQFERRKIRFVCADTVAGLPAGFDTGGGVRAGAGGAGGAAAAARAEEEAAAAEAAAAAAEARAALLAAGGDADDPVQQALKGALVAEAANDAFRAAAR